jgi:3-oxoacyl-[acyl-carrier-protein] synthase-3
MVTGLYILDDFIRRGVIRRGMVVSGEYVTSISDNATRKVRAIISKQLASLTVGDSGAAFIMERVEGESEGIVACELATYAEHSDLCIGVPCRDAPGAAMFTNAWKLQRVAIECAAPTVLKGLETSGLSPQDIDCLIPHQTSVRAIRAGMKRIAPKVGGLPNNIVYNLESYGNTASTTHFVALYQYLENRRFQPGERVALLVFASGVVCGGAVLTVDELCEKYGRDH